MCACGGYFRLRDKQPAGLVGASPQATRPTSVTRVIFGHLDRVAHCQRGNLRVHAKAVHLLQHLAAPRPKTLGKECNNLV